MKTFKIGGVHPAENKLSATSPIRRAGLPKQAVFSLYQHIGAPAKPVVAKGDEVKVGMMLAEADGSCRPSSLPPTANRSLTRI